MVRWSIPLLRRGGSREATDGVVPKGWKKGGRREAPAISFPSLGGVAVAKRLTGWSVGFPHTLKKTTPAAPPPPLLRRGIGA